MVRYASNVLLYAECIEVQMNADHGQCIVNPVPHSEEVGMEF